MAISSSLPAVPKSTRSETRNTLAKAFKRWRNTLPSPPAAPVKSMREYLFGSPIAIPRSGYQLAWSRVRTRHTHAMAAKLIQSFDAAASANTSLQFSDYLDKA
jgi:hypothetical protein